MPPEIIISLIGTAITFLGLLLVFFQVGSARRDTLTGSFISSISDHWQSIEARRLELRSQNIEAYYPKLYETLDEHLGGKQHKGNIDSLAGSFLLEPVKTTKSKKNAVFQAIANEYAFQDIVFNLYEEEFIAGWELKLVNRKLRSYWLSYMRESFKSPIVQHHWALRKEIGRTYQPFVEFVEKRLIATEE